MLYKVLIDDHHFTYVELDRAVWHVMIALEVGRETNLISELDYSTLMAGLGTMEDRNLPWSYVTSDGVTITINRSYGVDEGAWLVVGNRQTAGSA